MPLMVGTRIGSYDIVGLIGAGGMGEVYRARDARLGRDVAIKIVSPSIAADDDGLRRFEREARMLASLNHPNIAAIYGVEDHGDQPALILELVDGETLADRIARGRVPIDEALGYARHLADALDTAHEAGIVHRDLKPGNIKIAANGTVKVLDFGLAKAIAAAASPESAIDPAQSPTVTVRGTRGGTILGTAAYMSPEQARGKAIDKRTDIWAFGCVLYEMLAGMRPFNGETTSDVLAAIIERLPDWSKLPGSTPPHVRRVIERCLEKDPKRRARDIADVRAELDATPLSIRPARRPWMMAAGALLIAAGAAAAWLVRPSGAAGDSRFVMTMLPEPDTSLSGNVGVAISPDGRTVAFVATDAEGSRAIWLRDLDAPAAIRLDGTDGAQNKPFWSADGRHLGFYSAGYLRRVSREGGPVTLIARTNAFVGATWNRDDVIVVAPANRTALYRVPAAGGTLEPITTLDAKRENSHRWPSFLPDGDRFLFTARSDVRENNLIYVGSIRDRTIVPVRPAQSNAAYVPAGFLLFVERGTLMAQRFDAAALQLIGEPIALVSGVRHNPPSSEGFFSVSPDGTRLVYLTGERPSAHLMWFDRQGTHLGNLGPPRNYNEAKLSPDEQTLVVDIPDPDSGTRELWLMDVATAALTRFSSSRATDWVAAWSRDGTRIAFASDRAGLSSVFVKRVDGSGEDRLLYRGESGAFPNDWSPGDRAIIVHLDTAAVRGSILSVPTDGGAPTTVIEGRGFALARARLSPDARWIAYESTETATREIYVSPYGRPARTRVSTEGGSNARWRADGRELFYESPAGDLMAATVTPGERFAVSRPVRLFPVCRGTTPPTVFPGQSFFNVTRAGDRFLLLCAVPPARPSAIGVLINWAAPLD